MTLATETKTLSNLELFYEEVLRDLSLQEQLKAATSSENLIEIAVKLGAERGYNFDEAEVRKCLEREVSEQEISDLKTGTPNAYLSCGNCFC